ncbi:hypothetical protein M413DRAFT_70686 [Hebeloma cylindrosporum]|uniref:Uncharacterized protein n=1 Tax=Hebeloma cylindrosporum TaxID=76867 RepID=A0A0C3CF59_HEBCY|nr:hypothetical protein M413DRAFT_70686 [Hebeloma cylindrosporum h7]
MLTVAYVVGTPPGSPLDRRSKTWTPLPLRPYFWIPLIIVLVGAAIGLEIALYLSNKHQGWASGDTESRSTTLHYAYVVALWAWTDIEIKKIQASFRLFLSQQFLRMDSSSVQPPLPCGPGFIDGNSQSQFPAPSRCSARREGYMVATFVTWAGYAGAFILYELPAPPFIKVPYTVAAFELPTTISNGTAFVNTTAVKTSTGCQTIPVQMTQLGGGAWTNYASSNGCSITWSVSSGTDILFGADIPTCDSNQPPQFGPVVFWFFKYTPAAMASATFCYPSFSIWEVNVGVDVRTGNVTKVSEIAPFSQYSNFSSFSANVTGPPLNGRAYNGIRFNLTDPDQFVLGRQNATQLQLPAAIYQAATQSPEGYVGNFANGGFSALSDKVYGMYLALVAQQVYFLPDSEPINVEVRTFRKRVLVSDVAAHLLTTALLILAFFATIIQLFHRTDRQDLRLKHEPGTIALAVSIGAQTGVGNVLAGRQAGDDIKEALRDKKFRIDPVTMKIIMEGEHGYETAAVPPSPMLKRKSILDLLSGSGANGRHSQNLSGAAVTPTATPRSPSFPQPHTPKTGEHKYDDSFSANSQRSPSHARV